MAVIDLGRRSEAPPRPSFEDTFDQKTIVALADVGFVLDLLLRKNNEPIGEADCQYEFTKLHEKELFLKILLPFDTIIVVDSLRVRFAHSFSTLHQHLPYFAALSVWLLRTLSSGFHLSLIYGFTTELDVFGTDFWQTVVINL